MTTRSTIPMGVCPYCRRREPLRDDGTLITHGPGRETFICLGSNKVPDPKPSKRMA